MTPVARSATRAASIAAVGLTVALAVVMAAARDAPASLAVTGLGARVDIVRCPAEAVDIEPHARCGYVALPLDRAKPSGRKIRVYFELYPRRNRARPALSTVLTIEGGPGYPTSDDRGGRAAVWRPVSERRGLLLVDLRGTGRSGALACSAFAHSTVGYVERAGRCARELGLERDLYSTSQAVQDLEGVLQALGLGKVDLYGDSYGSYAAQAFALRYPERLRSLVLDGTYPLPGSDPAASDLVAAGRRGLELTCRRSPGCPRLARQDPVGLVSRFVDRIRAHPIDGFAPDGDGSAHARPRERGRARPDLLVRLLLPGALAGDSRRHPRGEARRYGADPAPRRGDDHGRRRRRGPARVLGGALPGRDLPRLPAALGSGHPAFGIGRPSSRRRLAAYPRGAFEPFSGMAWNGTDYEGWQACLRWPSPQGDDPPDPPGAGYPDVPTLVLNGDLDTITASSGAREVARRFPGSTFVEVRNSVHVTALYDKDDCASRIYVRFVKTLDSGDTTCARRVPEPHLVHAVPGADRGRRRRLGRRRETHRRGAIAGLRAAAAATVADVLARWWVNYDGTSVGLRGGAWSYEGDDPVVFALDRGRVRSRCRGERECQVGLPARRGHGTRNGTLARGHERSGAHPLVDARAAGDGDAPRVRRRPAPRRHDAGAVGVRPS